MDDEQNDYDRIVEILHKIVEITWVSESILNRSPDDETMAQALVPPALRIATEELNNLIIWVAGLAQTHRENNQ